jgi:hypothetical protein
MNIRPKALVSLALTLAALSSLQPARAQATYFTEYNKSITRLGAQGTIFYVGFVEPFTANCQWGNVYVAADRKGLYAQLLAAKLTNRRISRLDYSQPGGSGTPCAVELVELID